MKVVVVDYERFAGEPDFPPLNLGSFGWEQYVGLEPPEACERCWRADVVVTAQVPLGAAEMDGMAKLALVVIAGDDAALVDLDAARRRNIGVCHVPGLDPGRPDEAQRVCDEVVRIIEAFGRGEEYSRLT